MKRRAALLVLSVIVAAVGTGLIAVYVKGADDRAASDQRLVEVLVAAQAIGANVSGADIADTSLVTMKYPARTVPATAITGPDAAEIFKSKYQERFTVSKIPRGQPIVPESFSTGSGAVSTSGVPEDKMGVVLAMGNPDRAIGLITPGYPVTIFITNATSTKILISKAMVLAVDSQTVAEGDGSSSTSSSSASSDPRATSTVTLAVDVNQAATLILAKESDGKLYMAVPGTKLTDGQLAPGQGVSVKALSP